MVGYSEVSDQRRLMRLQNKNKIENIYSRLFNSVNCYFYQNVYCRLNNFVVLLKSTCI